MRPILHKTKLVAMAILVVIMLMVHTSFAQVTSIWINPISGSAISGNPYTTGNVTNANITVSGIGRGSGLTQNSPANNKYRAESWSTASTLNTSNNDYFTWTITPHTGYKMSMSSFVYTGRGGTGSTPGFSFRSNAAADNFATNIPTAATTGATISLAGSTYQNLSSSTEFRLYGWNFLLGTTTYSINDFTFNGSILGSGTTSFTGLGYVYGSATSGAQNFTINAAGLTTANAVVTIAGSTDFEVSTTSATTGFGVTATLTASGGSINSGNVWVRLKTGRAAGNYNAQNITISGGSVSGITIACSGSVTAAPLTISATNVSKAYGAVLTGAAGSTAFTTTALQNGETVGTVTIGYGTGSAATAAVGTYTATVTPSAATGGTFTASNYAITYTTGNIVVTARALTITANNVNKTYGATLSGSAGSTAFTTAGLQNGQTIGSVTIAYGTGAAPAAAVGTYTGTVSPSAATGGTFTAGNYSITYTTGNIILAAASLTITANNINKTYGASLSGSSGSTAFTSAGLQNGQTIGSVTIAYGTGATATAAVGGYTGTVSPSAATGGTFTAGNYSITYVTGNITVGVASLTITANNVNKTYGTALTGAAGSTAFTTSALQNGETVGTVTIAYGTGSLSTAAIGTYTGTVTASAVTGGTFTAGNYSISYVAGNITVGTASLTITANNVNKTYGAMLSGSAGSTAFTTAGLQNGQTIGSVTIAYGTGAAPAAAVGTYSGTVTPSVATGGTFTAGNYSITYTTGNIIVAAASLTITANNINKTYGATLSGSSGSTAFTSAGLQNGQTIGSVTIAYGTGAASAAAVGTYMGTVSPSAATGGTFTAGNYSITYVTGNITVGVASLTITTNNVNKTYGTALSGAAGSTAFTTSGLQNGETVGTVTIAYGTGSLSTAAIGTYTGTVTASAVTGGTFTAGNYSISYVAGNITVGTASLTITANNVNKTYGATLSGSAGSIAFTAAGLQNGQTIGSVTIAYGTGAAATMAVGTYTGTVTSSAASGGTFTPSNYSISYVTGNIIVGTAVLNITGATANNKLYDATTAVTLNNGSAILSGIMNGDIITLNSGSATATFVNKHVGTGKTITASGYTISGVKAGNYTLSQPAGITANITIRPITVTAISNTKVYDGTTGSAVVPAYTLQSGDATATAPIETYDTKNTGTGKTLTASGLVINDGNGGNNYSISYAANSTGVITKAAITVTAQTATKTYDGTTSSPIVPVVSGTFFGTDAVTTAAIQTFDTKNVGTGKILTASGLVINDGNGGNNYTISYTNNATGAITAKGITITVTAGQTKVYRTADPVFTYSTSPLLFGTDLFTGSLSRVAGENAGNYTITQGTISAGSNYSIGFVSNNFTITRANLTITANDQSKCEGQTLIFSGNEFIANGLLFTDAVTNVGLTSAGAQAGATFNGSPYPVIATNATGSGLNNYLISYVNGNLTIKLPSISGTTHTACNSYTWNGATYTSSGTYTYTTINSVGCDSIASLLLTINHSTTSTTSYTACNSYTWNGTTYMAAGTYTFNTTNAVGCDSIATLVLAINHSSTATSFGATACDSYSLPWGGSVTVSGDYPHTYTNASGCDSVVTAHITIKNSSQTSFSITACNSYGLPWGGSVTTSGNYQHIYSNISGCDSTVTAHITIIDLSIDAAISGPVNACAYTGAIGDTATYSIETRGISSFTWTIPSRATLISGQGTAEIRVKYDTSFVSGNISVNMLSGCGTSAGRSLPITQIVPAVPGTITGPLDACPFIKSGDIASYSIAPVPYTVFYEWTLPSYMVYVSGQGTTNISARFDSGYYPAPVNVRSVSGCGFSTDTSIVIGNILPVIPGVITGAVNACIYIGTNTQATYTIRKVPLSTSYIWSVPVGVTIISHPGGAGGNDTIINVTFDNTFVTSKFISVRTSSKCGTSSAKNITIYRTITSLPATISGPTNACSLMVSVTNPTGTQARYTIRKALAATSYNWTVPPGANINNHPGGPGVNDTIITVTFDTNFVRGSITVAAANGCGMSRVRALAITKHATSNPGLISGPVNACPLMQSASNPTGTQATYTIHRVANATGYTWNVPFGANIVAHPNGSGVNDTLIQVTYSSLFTNGNVRITANNNCASSITRSLAISRVIPATPGNITGPTDPCMWIGTNGATYAIRKVSNATGYTWTVPSTGATIISHPNGTGVNDTIIIVDYTNAFSAGTVTVTADVNCGSSAPKSLVLIKRPPAIPGIITASLVLECPARRYMYSVAALPANSTSMNWTVPATGTIDSITNGTLNIYVSYTSGVITGLVTSTGINSCATGISRIFAVNLSACSMFSTVGKGGDAFSGSVVAKQPVDDFQVRLMSNPTVSDFKLQVSTSAKEEIYVKLLDMAGKELQEFTLMPYQLVSFGSELTTGTYFIKISQGKNVATRKLLKF